MEGDYKNSAGSMVRLESRMQDYIRSLMPSAKVGYTVSLLETPRHNQNERNFHITSHLNRMIEWVIKFIG